MHEPRPGATSTISSPRMAKRLVIDTTSRPANVPGVEQQTPERGDRRSPERRRLSVPTPCWAAVAVGDSRLYFEGESLVLGLALEPAWKRRDELRSSGDRSDLLRGVSSRAGTTVQSDAVGESSEDVVRGNHREEEQGRAAAASGAAAACFGLSSLPGLILEQPDLETAVQLGRTARAASTSQ